MTRVKNRKRSSLKLVSLAPAMLKLLKQQGKNQCKMTKETTNNSWFSRLKMKGQKKKCKQQDQSDPKCQLRFIPRQPQYPPPHCMPASAREGD